MDEEKAGPSRPRQTSRTLYPDLHSAHAQILGRRTMSVSLATPSRGETRFPLSPASSAGEDEIGSLVAGHDDIPLQDMSCHRVNSAHGLLQEADHHQESSAIFETSDIANDSGHSGQSEDRLSATLDDIVSQYAVAPTGDLSVPSTVSDNASQSSHDSGLHRPNHTTEDDYAYHGNPGTFPGRNARDAYTDSLLCLKSQASLTQSLGDVEDLERQDEEWETSPESSPSGLLTPSRLRSHIPQRDTLATAESTFADKSPATPWDPLTSRKQRTRQTDLPTDRVPQLLDQEPYPLSHDQTHHTRVLREQQKASRNMSKQGSTRLMMSRTARATHGLEQCQQPRPVQSLSSPNPSATASSAQLTFQRPSGVASSSLFPRDTASALASSSLFPPALGILPDFERSTHENRLSISALPSTSAEAVQRIFDGPFSAAASSTSFLIPTASNHCPTFPLTAERLGVPRVPESLRLRVPGGWLEKAWCSVHDRTEFSHAALVNGAAGVKARSVDIQRQAGKVLLVVCMATFVVGGFVLAHDMGKGGALSSGAMAELTRWLSGREDGVVAQVHPVDAQLARAVERVGLLVVVVGLLACVGVLVWAAATM
ncbi:hypothetical protein ABEF92_000276 [Exophiala dermatitidis]|uniref:Uncharacterized protein n=1 Tax=Exophiala dermatitidis (strain ATCC 34100 / CBS 525.76 / NIH/UT8656) TaxID=858893 RepID=H6C460_EXODN|nr:uncharacterized protein HMPREF1120_05614 [Exophiala dermatitidis NIH/UT8656]EHY57585.1 hypothetical protein HMPREF1120_05614 [Exophiala dermatitidis NIH/UT8656]